MQVSGLGCSYPIHLTCVHNRAAAMKTDLALCRLALMRCRRSMPVLVFRAALILWGVMPQWVVLDRLLRKQCTCALLYISLIISTGRARGGPETGLPQMPFQNCLCEAQPPLVRMVHATQEHRPASTCSLASMTCSNFVRRVSPGCRPRRVHV